MDASALVPDDLLSSVVEHFKPRRVILFGSRARGENDGGSDYDLVVVVDDDTPAEKLSWRSVYESRKGFHGAVDIVACREKTLREKGRAIGSFAHTILEGGRVVYERQRP